MDEDVEEEGSSTELARQVDRVLQGFRFYTGIELFPCTIVDLGL